MTATLANIRWSLTPCLCCNGSGLTTFQHLGDTPRRREYNQRQCRDCHGTGYHREIVGLVKIPVDAPRVPADDAGAE